MTADDVRAWLAKEAVRYGGQKKLAAVIGISPAFLSDILRGMREPSGKPVQWLGLIRRVEYVEIEK